MEMFWHAEDISGMVYTKLVITFASRKRAWVSWGTGEGAYSSPFVPLEFYTMCVTTQKAH